MNTETRSAPDRATPLWFGAYAPPAPMSGMSAVTELEGRIGRKLDVVHFYQAWGGRWKAFDQRSLSVAGGDRAVMLSWEPWVPGGPADQADFSLESILSPRHVGYITTWAGQLRSYGQTVYLRPMHEMNGNWYPWSGRRCRRPWKQPCTGSRGARGC